MLLASSLFMWAFQVFILPSCRGLKTWPMLLHIANGSSLVILFVLMNFYVLRALILQWYMTCLCLIYSVKEIFWWLLRTWTVSSFYCKFCECIFFLLEIGSLFLASDLMLEIYWPGEVRELNYLNITLVVPSCEVAFGDYPWFQIFCSSVLL